VERLARQIQADYGGRPLLVVGALRGAFDFMADLVRRLQLPLTVDFMRLASYCASTSSSGRVRLLHGLRSPVRGRDVLVVEDIVDTALTTSFLLSYLKERGAASVRICALLDKPARRRVRVSLDYVGFTVQDRFLVGYGLDFDQRYRELPAVYALEEGNGP
jgi:hypoxanthine phosphoribosyltransferase